MINLFNSHEIHVHVFGPAVRTESTSRLDFEDEKLRYWRMRITKTPTKIGMVLFIVVFCVPLSDFDSETDQRMLFCDLFHFIIN